MRKPPSLAVKGEVQSLDSLSVCVLATLSSAFYTIFTRVSCVRFAPSSLPWTVDDGFFANNGKSLWGWISSDWAFGSCETSAKEGLFPLNAVKLIDESGGADTEKTEDDSSSREAKLLVKEIDYAIHRWWKRLKVDRLYCWERIALFLYTEEIHTFQLFFISFLFQKMMSRIS